MNEVFFTVERQFCQKDVEQFIDGIDSKQKYQFFKQAKKKDREVFVVKKNDIVIGLYVFLFIEDEKYLELLFYLSSETRAFDYLLLYLSDNYKEYKIDFVFDKDEKMVESLKKYNCIFEKDQYVMKLKDYKPVNIIYNIVNYCEKYRDQYTQLHSKDVYWTADKVINSPEQFKIFLCLVDNQVVGYVDMSYCFTVNQPFDVFVKKEYRNRGICKEMLTVAINSNENRQVELTVDYDSEFAIKAYRSLGFDKVGNLISTVHMFL